MTTSVPELKIPPPLLFAEQEGSFLAGVIADTLGLTAAIYTVAAITAVSGVVVILRIANS